MDIIIEERAEAPAVIIRCKSIDEHVTRLKAHIELFEHRLTVQQDGARSYIETTSVLYFESVDDRTFLYTDGAVLESSLRLYEVENALSDHGFLRISKSVVVNLYQIRSLRPEINRTITATMCNGERLVISRLYAKKLRSLLHC